MKCQLIAEDLHTGKERLEQEEKGGTEYEMVGWHQQLSGHESEQSPGDKEGQSSLSSMGSQRVGHDLASMQYYLDLGFRK